MCSEPRRRWARNGPRPTRPATSRNDSRPTGLRARTACATRSMRCLPASACWCTCRASKARRSRSACSRPEMRMSRDWGLNISASDTSHRQRATGRVGFLSSLYNSHEPTVSVSCDLLTALFSNNRRAGSSRGVLQSACACYGGARTAQSAACTISRRADEPAGCLYDAGCGEICVLGVVRAECVGLSKQPVRDC